MTDTALALFLKDNRLLSSVPADRRYAKLELFEYPYDLQLLSLSPLYRESRKQYLALGGRLSPRVSSTMRSLSAQDLFADEIDYTPAATEIDWFLNNVDDVYDPADELFAIERFNTISVFHEQNHRILWRFLPPAPKEERDLIRYLNLAEALVVMLDLALAEQVGPKLSPAFERMKVIYRTSGKKSETNPKALREQLIAMFCSTYFLLEMMNPEDILKAVDFVLPGQKALNRKAVGRALDLNEMFTRVTNPQWQERQWKIAREKLTKLQKTSYENPLYLPEDPLDLEEEIVIARAVLDHFDC